MYKIKLMTSWKPKPEPFHILTEEIKNCKFPGQLIWGERQELDTSKKIIVPFTSFHLNSNRLCNYAQPSDIIKHLQYEEAMVENNLKKDRNEPVESDYGESDYTTDCTTTDTEIAELEFIDKHMLPKIPKLPQPVLESDSSNTDHSDREDEEAKLRRRAI